MKRRVSRTVFHLKEIERTPCRFCKRTVHSTDNPEVWTDYNGRNNCGMGGYQHKPEDRR